MCRVKIAPSAGIFSETPHIPVAVFAKITSQKVMYIGTFTVHDISKESLSGHIQSK